MRVALLNNMNNMAFSVARYLRDRGHDVTLLVMNQELVEAAHFDPSCDTFDLAYQAYMRRLEWGDGKAFATHDMKRVERDLAPYDFVIGSGSAPAYMARIGRRLDVFMPFGYDLAWDPFRPPAFNRRSLRSLLSYPMWQRRGIRASRHVLGDWAPSMIEEPLARLGYEGHRVYASPAQPYGPIYAPEVVERYKGRTYWYPLIQAFRDRMDVVITCQSCHVWKNPNAVRFSKGNDKIIRAVASLKERRPGARVGIVFYEYGFDVEASRDLIAELGVEDAVLWLPRSNRKDIMVNLSLTDFAVGELGSTSWFSGGAIFEGLCAGKPLLHRRDDAEFVERHPDMYPRVNVHAAEDIVTAVLGYLDASEPYREMGRRGRAWFEEHVAGRSISAVEALFTDLPRVDGR